MYCTVQYLRMLNSFFFKYLSEADQSSTWVIAKDYLFNLMPNRIQTSLFFFYIYIYIYTVLISFPLCVTLVYIPHLFPPAMRNLSLRIQYCVVQGQEEGTLTTRAAAGPFSSAKVLQISLLSSFLTWALPIYMRNRIASF